MGESESVAVSGDTEGAKPREEEPVPRRSDDICKVLLNGPDQYRDHLKSKRHKHEKARGGPGRCVLLTEQLRSL